MRNESEIPRNVNLQSDFGTSRSAFDLTFSNSRESTFLARDGEREKLEPRNCHYIYDENKIKHVVESLLKSKFKTVICVKF